LCFPVDCGRTIRIRQSKAILARRYDAGKGRRGLKTKTINLKADRRIGFPFLFCRWRLLFTLLFTLAKFFERISANVRERFNRRFT
jgi:hypothetical protein